MIEFTGKVALVKPVLLRNRHRAPATARPAWPRWARPPSLRYRRQGQCRDAGPNSDMPAARSRPPCMEVRLVSDPDQVRYRGPAGWPSACEDSSAPIDIIVKLRAAGRPPSLRPTVGPPTRLWRPGPAPWAVHIVRGLSNRSIFGIPRIVPNEAAAAKKSTLSFSSVQGFLLRAPSQQKCPPAFFHAATKGAIPRPRLTLGPWRLDSRQPRLIRV